MKYMLLCYDDEPFWQAAGKAVQHQAIEEAVGLCHEMNAKRQYLLASPLQSVATASCVRIRNGKPVVTDGPFAETREVLGGFYLIDVSSREEAIAIAARHPGARVGTVEVRPVMEIAGLPTS